MQSLGNAFSSVANNPSGTPSMAVQAATNTTASLQSMSTQVQALREKADQQIGSTVDTINTTLQNIATLNSQISGNSAAGIDVSELQDQRDQQLNTLSQYINFHHPFRAATDRYRSTPSKARRWWMARRRR